jgi:hypothetical protein
MDDAMAVGAQNRKVFYLGSGAVLNLGQRKQVVNLAVGARGTAVSAAERKPANLAVK